MIRAIALLALTLALPGCASENELPKPWMNETAFGDLIAQAIDDATAGGASQQQLELLELAQVEGDVSYDVTRVAVLNAIECFEEYGGTGVYEDTEVAKDYTVPGYTVAFDQSIGEIAIEGFIDACETRETYWVRSVYQQQPTSRELIGQHVLSKEGELRMCLEREGISTDPDDDGWDLALVALDAMLASDFAIACLWEADIQSM